MRIFGQTEDINTVLISLKPDFQYVIRCSLQNPC